MVDFRKFAGRPALAPVAPGQPAAQQRPQQFQNSVQPQSTVHSLFKKVLEATVNEGGVYILPGTYVVDIEALKMIRTFRGVDMFIAELFILWSSVVERQPGTQMSWTAGFDKPSTAGNVHGFFNALCPGEELTVEDLERAVGPENPLKGARLYIEANHVPTKNGGVYTKCRFRLTTEEEDQALNEG